MVNPNFVMPVIEAAPPPELESLKDIDARIRRTFNALEIMAHGIVSGNIRSLIISGAAGCGKTHTMEEELSKGQKEGNIEYTTIRGTMSAIGLYKELWNHANAGQVLVVDDCDAIFSDLDALNLLKAALDTSLVRRVHWNKESSVLEAEGIPRSFEFDGAMAFITNIDFGFEVEKESKMSPHYGALLSRSIYVDLGIHTKREVLVRIGQVAFTEEFLRVNKLTAKQAKEIVGWLKEHLTKMRVISIRSVLQLAALVKTQPDDWRDLAEVVMLSSKGRKTL
jgi:hypothetical protein